MDIRYKISFRHRMCEDGCYVTTPVASTDTRADADAIRWELNRYLDELYDALGRDVFDTYYGLESEYSIMQVQMKEAER